MPAVAPPGPAGPGARPQGGSRANSLLPVWRCTANALMLRLRLIVGARTVAAARDHLYDFKTKLPGSGPPIQAPRSGQVPGAFAASGL